MVKGSIVALVTPFDKEKNIDYKSLNKLLDLHLKSKCDGLLLMGTTQESVSLSDSEKREFAEYVSKYINNRIKLIIGLISNKYYEILKLAKLYEGLNFDSYLVIGPYYTKSNISGLLKYFTNLADRLDHPIILYNVPKRCGFEIPIAVVTALSYHQNIIGIKDASGNIDYMQELLNLKSDKFILYSGDDQTALLALLIGFDGWISVIGNYYSLECKAICDNKDKKLYYSIFPVIKLINKEVSPICMKYVLYCLGLIEPNYRYPLDLPMLEMRREIEILLDELNK